MTRFTFILMLPFLTILAPPAHADGDLARGKELFKTCAKCHSLRQNSHRTGPSLYGVIGAPAGRAENYRYSNAMREKAAEGLVWTDENLNTFLTKPRRFVRFTKMSFRGFKEAADRAAVIAYLKANMP